MTSKHARIDLPTTPGAIIGYRRNGTPIRLIGGGSGEGEGEGGGASTPPAPAPPVFQPPAAAPKPAPPASPPNGGQEGGQTAPPAAPPAAKDGDVASLPDWAQKLISDTRAEAGKARTNAKETAAQEARNALAQEIGKALGLVKDEPIDPAKLAEELGSEKSRARGALVELAVYKSAGKHGADPEALTDSRTFLDRLDKLDPTADDFTEKLNAAIKKAVEDNPKLKAAAQEAPPSRSGGEFTGGSGDKAPDTGSKSIDDFRAERRKRREVASSP